MAAGKEVGRLSIKVTPDLDGFYREVKRAVDWAEGQRAEVKVTADTSAFRREVAAATRNLPDAEVKVKYDRSIISQVNQTRKSFFNATKAAKDFGDSTSFLSKSPDMTWGTVFLAIGALAAPAIGGVAALLAGLPSLFAAAGAGATTLALGLEGIKEAGELSGLFSVDDRGDMHFGEALQSLRDGIGEVFKAGLTPLFQQWIGMIPQLQAGFEGIAQGMVDIASGITNALTSSGGMQAIQAILAGTGQLFHGLTPVIENATSSFLKLSAAGAGAFDKLLAPLEKYSVQFDAIVDRLVSSGAFESAMQGLSTVLDSLLTQFGRIFEVGVEQFGKMGEPIATFFNGIGDAVVALMPGLTALSNLILGTLGTALSALAPAIEAATPGFVSLANTLGTLFSGSLKALAPVLEQVGATLSTTLVTAMEQLAPILPQLASSFAQLTNAVVTGLGPILPQLATSFGELAGQFLLLTPSILNLLTTGIIPMVPQFLALWQASMPLTQTFLAMAPAVLRLANMFLLLVTPLVGIASKLAAAGAAFVLFMADIQNSAARGWATVQAVFQTGVAAISGLLSSLSGTLSGIWDGVTTAASAAWNTVVSTVQSAWTQVVAAVTAGVDQAASYVATLPGKIASALAGLAAIGAQAGRDLVQGIINGIGELVGAAVAKARELASSVAGAVKGFLGIHSPSKLMDEYGRYTGQGFINGLGSTQGELVGTAREVMQAVAEVFGDSKNVTINFNFGEAQKQLSGLQTTLQDTATASTALTSELTAPTADLTSGSSLLSGDVKNQLDELKLAYDQLELQRKQLKVDKNAAGTKEEKKAIQDQIDQIQAQKDQIALEKDKLKLQQQQTGQMGEQKTLAQFLGEQIASTWQQGTDAVAGFARANLDQAMGDLGIGGGALTNGMNAALDWGTQALGNVMNIQVNSVDDAIAVKNNEVNKQALTYTRR
ncbi:tape measure protein [Mycobacterium phage STLscum]|nr:tape measure protein [Mycobacterium phage STLscum]